MKDRIIIGTRRSRLALVQTELVARALSEAFPGLTIVRKEIVTQGDRDHKTPLSEAASPGIFTRAIETRLLAGEIDLAVHSLKDLPTELVEGLMIAATPTRADPRDALVFFSCRGGPMRAPLQEMKRGAVVGTSSPRRSAQLFAIRPDLVIKDLRGNVDTRLAKLARGDYDAIIVAKAALDRLAFSCRRGPMCPPSSSVAGADPCACPGASSCRGGSACPPGGPHSEENTGPHIGGPLQLQRQEETLDPAVVLPAPAQGALAVECREGDIEVAKIAGAINDAATFVATSAERALLAALGGGCHLALGALAEAAADGSLRLRAAAFSRDGRRAARADVTGRTDDPARVVEECRRKLVDLGVEEMLG
jgi:hydroxymethylbilane synthase